MKKILFFIISFLTISFSIAQPQKMTYQAVVRNTNNELIMNQQIGIQISIIEDNTNGPIAYSERHTAQTNANALFSIVIGTGTPLLITSMADIKWDKHNHYMKIEIDPTGGTNYTITGTQQLLSVPYSLYSNKSKYVDTALYATSAASAIHSTYADSSLNSYSAIYSTYTDSSWVAIYAINAIYSDTTLYAYNAVHSDTAGYSAIANSALNAIYSDTSLFAANSNHAIYADTALYLMNAQTSDTAKFAYSSDTANYANSAAAANTATSALTANHSDTSLYATNSHHAIYADTALYLMNAQTSDTAKFAYSSDTANYALNTNHANSANYADSSNYNHLSNRPVGTNRGDILYWEPNDSSWHIVPAGNVGETLTMDTNHIPYWHTDTIALATVVTDSVTNITTTSANVISTITNDGGAAFVFRGVCWDTVANPTILNEHTFDGIGVGAYISHLPNLTINKTYYARAYTTNSKGTAYGNTLSFNTVGFPPTVITTAASNITGNSAVTGGIVTSDGGTPVTERGICWNTSGNPTLADSVISNGNGIGSFTVNMTGLNGSTTYYVRAYAINVIDTSFGEIESFTTLFLCGTTKVKDYDNNEYATLQLGTQCWMKENLRTTHYANGDNIDLGSTTSTVIKYRYYPKGDSNYVSSYGFLYNWIAAMNGSSSSIANPSGIQGVCPSGWHLPSSAEWLQMTNYVRAQPLYTCNNTNIAKALASKIGWNSSNNTCAVGNDPSINDETGFGAMPAGFFKNYSTFGEFADIWSSTEYNSSSAYFNYLYVGDADMNQGDYSKTSGLSVRCVKD